MHKMNLVKRMITVAVGITMLPYGNTDNQIVASTKAELNDNQAYVETTEEDEVTDQSTEDSVSQLADQSTEKETSQLAGQSTEEEASQLADQSTEEEASQSTGQSTQESESDNESWQEDQEIDEDTGNVSGVILDQGGLDSAQYIELTDDDILSTVETKNTNRLYLMSASEDTTYAQYEAAQVEVTSSASGSVAYGAGPTITATVSGTSGTPTGTVSFYQDSMSDSNLLRTVELSSGTASIQLNSEECMQAVAAGTHTIYALYSGDNATYSSSNVSTSVTITRATPAIGISTVASAAMGDTIVVNVTVSNQDCTDLTLGLPDASDLTISCNDTELGTVTADSNTQGLYTYSYTVPTTASEQIVFQAKLSETDYYEATESATSTVTVSSKLVSFDNMGHGTAPESQILEAGDLVTDPGDLSASRYSFLGWYTSSDEGETLDEQWDFTSDTVSESMTLYAKWEAVVSTSTISFTGGSSALGTAPDSITAYEGDSVTLPDNTFTKAGYSFAGWKTGSTTYQAGATFTATDEDVTFTAVWSLNIVIESITAEYSGSDIVVGSSLSRTDLTVQAVMNDGSTEDITSYSLSTTEITAVGDNTITVTYGDYSTTVTVTGIARAVESVSAAYSKSVGIGKTLDTTYLTVTLTYNDGSTETITSGYTISSYTIVSGTNELTLTYGSLTTTFEVEGTTSSIYYTVTFRPLNGDSSSSVTVAYGSTVSIPTATKSGYTLYGWYTKTGGNGTKLTSSTQITADTTYYAYWVVDSSSLTITNLVAVYTGSGYVGSLSTSDFTVLVYYNTGKVKTVTSFTMSKDSLSLGENTVTITYGGESVNVTITVTGSTVTALTATYIGDDKPIGDTVSEDEVRVIATFSDGTTEVVTGFTIAETVLVSGSNSIKVTYQSVTTTVTVTGYAYYTVTFNSKGGKSVDSIKVVKNAKIGTLPKTTYKYHEFNGWYLEASYTNKCIATTKITGNITLYAKWTEETPYTLNKTGLTLKAWKQGALFVVETEDVYWESADTSIAVVNQSGIVTGLKKGTTTITAMTEDGYTLSCTVTVGTKIKKITLNKKKKTLSKGKSFQIKATISPKNATTKGLTYRSSNTSVAVVNSKGKVVAKGSGTCYIYVSAKDSSNIVKKVKITVK